MNWNNELKTLREKNERESREYEERIRDLRRRIAELRERLHTPQPTRVFEDEKVAEPIPDVGSVEKRRRSEERLKKLEDEG